MQKIAIAKAISIIMGICIIACMISIVVFIMRSAYTSNRQEQSSKISEIILPNSGKIKDFKIFNGKIYLLVKNNQKEEIIVIKEEEGKIIMNVKLGVDNE